MTKIFSKFEIEDACYIGLPDQSFQYRRFLIKSMILGGCLYEYVVGRGAASLFGFSKEMDNYVADHLKGLPSRTHSSNEYIEYINGMSDEIIRLMKQCEERHEQ